MSAEIHPLTPDRWDDLAELFDSAGVTRGCWCMWWRGTAKDFDRADADAKRASLKAIVQAGPPPGLLAYDGGRAVGWVQVTPRADVPRFNASRTGKPDRGTNLGRVWAITCFFTARDHRGKGLMTALARAALGFAAGQGARAVEAAALLPKSRLQWSDGYVGIVPALERAGFARIEQRTTQRVLMRAEIPKLDGGSDGARAGETPSCRPARPGTRVFRRAQARNIFPPIVALNAFRKLDLSENRAKCERNSISGRCAMFEDLGFETLTAPQAAIWLGAILGLGFGVLAQITRFCLRRALAGDPGERRPALAVWLTALAVAVIGTQIVVAQGWFGFEDHRFMAADLPVAAILAGGALFGAGMVLTRGCVSRLTVLLAGGNLRALTVLAIFAVTAHATLKGVLAPLRTSLGSVTVSLDSAALPGAPLLWGALVAALAAAVAWRSGAKPLHLGLAALLGLLVPAGWAGTGYVLYDDFDPVALQSLSFTAPYADTLFWAIASTSIPANFGVGLVGGTLAGALVAALLRHEFAWQSFAGPAQTGRYVLGAVLMGVGGVLAGGCTVGAGLAGIPTLSIAAALALAAIALGALATDRALRAAGPGRTQPVPAE